MDFSSIDCFTDLSEAQRAELLAASRRLTVSAGQTLMQEGDDSKTMFFVVSGRFAISIQGHDSAIAEIGSGQSIGEIGFLSGSPRTATAVAVRDSVVLELSDEQFDRLCELFPQVLKSVSMSLARKLSAATNAYRDQPFVPPSTLALLPAGASEIDQRFLQMLVAATGQSNKVRLLTTADVPDDADNAEALAGWLHEQETAHDVLIYVAATDSDPWTAVCIRQADQLILVANGESSEIETDLNAIETRVARAAPGSETLLVVCHDERSPIEDTGRWLAGRDVAMLHHVAYDDPGTFERLSRFLDGSARGLVASGGGAFTAAHTGVFRAFEEAGISFDIVGGASGGAAVGCSIPVEVDYQTMIDGTEQMMVASGALKRYTLPIYSLVDHRYFDECMREHYGERRIEDFWINFFAVSTNLSSGELAVHQRGPLWKALRASASIPGMLPPMISEDGDLLVDGGILDNVPLSSMKTLKSGPNIVLSFEPRQQGQTDARYEELPGRAELVKRAIQPGKSIGADMPRIGSVLTQCMLLNNTSMTEARDTDLILSMALPDDLKLNDWHRHREITEIGYQQAKQWLADHANNPVLQQFLD